MLTKNIVEYVNEFYKVNDRINELFKERSDILYYIRSQINHDEDESYITDFKIVNEPNGKKQPDGTYVDERCTDSLFMPDSGCGTQYYPIENNLWLAVCYQW